ncbi:Cut9-interacting protein scn1 [Friedmanniomyces endolithicus]|uniref:Cut9-interacting protein scn1 n=2 Tax=Friedmanniomyces endolithicus TaxID=329885 RepID=A0AAN6H3D9_9PEZI|nr:Cut9-interacting protein scn1 [Friedmanniomyces endolithicus]KAK0302013.1 Cut9-interacting protein scn1 [Friedmanniomyces endolithicus]KAK0829251.1 Cut9-interacting protein scn1 [Friedmanniomyces endolithicus]KAK0953136.1 Cut9-interacting protein scn1 [Friedmanniomyces endolithicus]KAK0975079.1 Cut9-interacting protein scn1 [Friedmanniomyces endolithicus]
MRARVLTVMATRAEDQELVSNAATRYGVTEEDAQDPTGTDWSKDHKVIPAFGWHPWFSHQMYDESEYDGATSLSDEQKVSHYTLALTPQLHDREFLLALPDPQPFGQFLSRTKEYLLQHPLALVGEVGLDRSFRIPQPWLPDQAEQRDDSLTPGGREGRQLSQYRVSMKHQRKIFPAQLRLAGEMQRAVSVHGVAAHGAVYETLAETWKGQEIRVNSKREQKRVEAEVSARAQGESPEAQRNAVDLPGAALAKPFPPRICLHSYSGPAETVKLYTAPTVPCEVFMSFSTTINHWSSGDGRPGKTGKVEAAIQALPDDRILIESDMDMAGDRMDGQLEAAVRKVDNTLSPPCPYKTPPLLPAFTLGFAARTEDSAESSPGPAYESKYKQGHKRRPAMEIWDIDQYAQIPENQQDRSATCCFVYNLFGINTPPVPVYGSVAAIDELIKAIVEDGLFIQRHATARPTDSIKVARHHLEKKGDFTDDIQLRAFYDISDDADLPELDGLDGNLLFKQHPVVALPFKTLEVEGALAALIRAAKHHEFYSNMMFGQAQQPVYQLGVVTMTSDAYGAPHFEAQLFSSRADAIPTSTLWMYRWCIAAADGGYREQWRALSDGTFDFQGYARSLLTQRGQQIKPVNHAKKRTGSYLDEREEYAIDPSLSAPESNHRGKRARPDQVFPLDYPMDHLFHDTPERITGATILHLARFYSNQELFRHINDGLTAKGMKNLKEENVVTRRITCAISSQASNSQMTGPEIREELDEARRVNGVRARMIRKTMAKKEANRAAKMVVSGGNEPVPGV